MEEKIKNEDVNEQVQDRMPQDTDGAGSGKDTEQPATDSDRKFERKLIIAIIIELVLMAVMFVCIFLK